jgi:hypothetical protein
MNGVASLAYGRSKNGVAPLVYGGDDVRGNYRSISIARVGTSEPSSLAT